MWLVYGVDSLLWCQYLYMLLVMLYGDFGYFLQVGLVVSSLIVSNLLDILSFVLLVFLLVVVLVFVFVFVLWLLGLCWLSNFLQLLLVLFIFLFIFWLGIVLIQFFLFQLCWILVINFGLLEGLILLVIVVVLFIFVLLVQILMCSMDQVVVQFFVVVVCVKGMSEMGVFWCYVMGNVLLLVLNIVGLLFGELIVGVLIIEIVFGCSGFGQLIQQVVNNQDIVVLQVVVMIFVFGFVLINLLVDLVML